MRDRFKSFIFKADVAERRTDLIAVTKHGRENVLQEGEDVLVGLEQTPHGLQLHHL